MEQEGLDPNDPAVRSQSLSLSYTALPTFFSLQLILFVYTIQEFFLLLYCKFTVTNMILLFR